MELDARSPETQYVEDMEGAKKEVERGRDSEGPEGKTVAVVEMVETEKDMDEKEKKNPKYELGKEAD